ncbi:FAD-binding protein [Ulvibacterium sp.]|uniref:FAD-binding protein n=1 Tax=Ulvibacterium sp. TaxID=2665914 RepID=UPI002615E603|nr:FAD-binding protein [Ulvibacterium sp.]
MDLFENYSLKKYNTFGIDVKASEFFSFVNIGELEEFVEKRSDSSKPFFILGGGSNVLFTQDFKGLVLHSKIENIEVIEENDRTVTLRVGSGLEWDKFVAYCVERSLYGIENLSLIPGNVGAAPVQNIGAYGTEVEEVIVGVCAFDFGKSERVYLTNDECCFRYRDSIFKRKTHEHMLITYVDFKLNKIPPHRRKLMGYRGNILKKRLKHYTNIVLDLIGALRTLKFNRKKKSIGIDYRILRNLMENLGFISLKKVRQTIINKRNSKIPSPKQIGNVGSFFKNPIVCMEKANKIKREFAGAVIYPYDTKNVKISAGWLIKNIELPKGYHKVGLYKDQTLIIVNKANASGREIFDYSQKILEKVQEKFQISLEREVVVI